MVCSVTSVSFVVPNVDSSIINLDLFEETDGIANYQLFKKVVKTCFNNRRKMLRNSLKKIVESSYINKIKSVQLDIRPEELSIQDFKSLSNEISDFYTP